jgi:hypothetical protein
MGQRMIGFGGVMGRKLVGGMWALYSVTGEHVIVQGELESKGCQAYQ